MPRVARRPRCSRQDDHPVQTAHWRGAHNSAHDRVRGAASPPAAATHSCAACGCTHARDAHACMCVAPGRVVCRTDSTTHPAPGCSQPATALGRGVLACRARPAAQVQCGKGAIQKRHVHRVGRGRPGEAASLVAALLQQHGRPHLCGGQRRQGPRRAGGAGARQLPGCGLQQGVDSRSTNPAQAATQAAASSSSPCGCCGGMVPGSCSPAAGQLTCGGGAGAAPPLRHVQEFKTIIEDPLMRHSAILVFANKQASGARLCVVWSGVPVEPATGPRPPVQAMSAPHGPRCDAHAHGCCMPAMPCSHRTPHCRVGGAACRTSGAP